MVDRVLRGAAAVGAAAALGPLAPAAEKAVRKGRIKQSIVYWCFEPYWQMPQAIEVARRLGCVSIELMAPKYFPMIKQAGLTCSLGFARVAFCDLNRRRPPASFHAQRLIRRRLYQLPALP